MLYWDAVFAFLAATAVAALLTPLAARLARRIGAMSRPSARGLAQNPTPLLGGVAILAAVLVASLIWLPATILLPRPPHGEVGIVHTWLLLAGAGVITLVGAIDDARPLNPLVKLLGQVAAAIVAVKSGAAITDVTIPFLAPLQFTDASGPVTVLWLVALMNIVNFSDGIDGLAAGVCTIDSIAFSIIAFSLQGGGSAAAVMAALTAGAALGFLFHNFYPAKVFMGDAGANLLGYLLGVTAVIGSIKTNAVISLAVPLLVLAVPFLDTSFVVAKRLKYGRAPWSADANHFHHRMARIGFSQRKTVIYLYAWTLMLAGVAIALHFVPYSRHDGTFRVGWSIVMALILVGAVAASIYLVYVLEIFKFKGIRATQMRGTDPGTTDAEIDESVERDVQTGEFEAVQTPDSAATDAPEPIEGAVQGDVETGEFGKVRK